MNGKNRFLNAMGEIDSEYLKEHIEYKKSRGINLGKMISITASAAAVIAIVAVTMPFLKNDTVLPPADTTLAVSDTSDTSDTKFPVLYSQLSGIASVPEYDTLPADGEVRLSGELKSLLASDGASDPLYAVSLSYTSSKFIECSSDPVMAEKAEDIFRSYEQEMAALQENFLKKLEDLNENFRAEYYEDQKNFALEEVRRTEEITDKYISPFEEIKERYPDNYEEQPEYQELIQKMNEEMKSINNEQRQKYLAWCESWREKLFKEHRSEITQIIKEHKENISKIMEEHFKEVIENGEKDIYADMSDLVDSWLSSESYANYQKEFEEVILGGSNYNPGRYFKQWFEEYRQKIYKEARSRITKEVYGIDDESTVCSHLDEMKVDYSRLTVKTVSDDDIVTDDNDRIITFMTQEQIENFAAPETIGIDLELAPNDWQDEDSDSIVYSKIRG